MDNEYYQYNPETVGIWRTTGLADIEPYIKLIQNETVRRWVRAAFEAAPHYFWVIPAAASGKYHPALAQGEAGLLRHTEFTMYLAHEFSRTFECTDWEHDVAVAAAAVHDTLKYGYDYDVRYHEMHPYLPRNYYCGKHGCLADDIKCSLGREMEDAIFDAVERHMGSIESGSWAPVGSAGRVRPESKAEYVVHLADYTSSRTKVHFTDFLL